MRAAKILYGAGFMVGLPCLLALWARGAEANISLGRWGGPIVGWSFTGLGLLLMAEAMRELWSMGGGLPMNAFPPPRLVAVGAFRWIPHPIYAGFTAVCFGLSMILQSAAGLWLVTPTLVLASTALVLGYERGDLRRRLGDTVHVLPADDEAPPSKTDIGRFYVLTAIPWLALYEFTIHMGLRGTAFAFPFESHLRIYTWAAIVYESTYITVGVAPWCARTKRDLRQLTISAWAALAVVFPIYWVMPSSAPRRAMADDNWLAHVLGSERNAYPPTAAFPSFHTLWAIFVGRLYRPRWVGIGYAAAVAISCVATGMHYIADVLAAVAMAPFLLQPQQAWRWMLAMTERAANSWREWRIGPVRIINHGSYAGAAAFVPVLLVTAAVGPGKEWKVGVSALAGLIGAAVWAQWVEGSSLLRRPFGFYGGFAAVGIACLFFEERWILLGAYCLGAPWMQAIGRLRCLVNGCCHGAPAMVSGSGIRVREGHSRVVRLAGLADVPIYPTQLYSILSNVMLGLVVAHLWGAGCPVSLICGVYGIGNGVTRFGEEGFRGEPQTMIVLGLRLYQWLATGTVVLGAVLSTLPAPAAPALTFSFEGLVWAAAFALLAAAAMGIDFPEVNRPLARLT